MSARRAKRQRQQRRRRQRRQAAAALRWCRRWAYGMAGSTDGAPTTLTTQPAVLPLPQQGSSHHEQREMQQMKVACSSLGHNGSSWSRSARPGNCAAALAWQECYDTCAAELNTCRGRSTASTQSSMEGGEHAWDMAQSLKRRRNNGAVVSCRRRADIPCHTAAAAVAASRWRMGYAGFRGGHRRSLPRDLACRSIS